MYPIINLAVGGTWPGSPDSTTVFPAYLEVDYVRVYANNSALPVISAVSASPVGPDSATINWTTDQASDSQVAYGLSASYGYLTQLNPSLTTAHSQTLSSLTAGTTYHFAVKSGNAAGTLATSADNSFETSVAHGGSGSGSGSNDSSGDSCSSGGGGGCFIATAAYGSYLDPHVVALRAFRDEHLLTNAPGRAFVRFYYRYSPPVAAFLENNDRLKMVTRCQLTPVVFTAEHESGALIVVIFLAGGFFAKRRRPRRRLKTRRDRRSLPIGLKGRP